VLEKHAAVLASRQHNGQVHDHHDVATGGLAPSLFTRPRLQSLVSPDPRRLVV
jgi:hypothetical protein